MKSRKSQDAGNGAFETFSRIEWSHNGGVSFPKLNIEVAKVGQKVQA